MTKSMSRIVSASALATLLLAGACDVPEEAQSSTASGLTGAEKAPPPPGRPGDKGEPRPEPPRPTIQPRPDQIPYSSCDGAAAEGVYIMGTCEGERGQGYAITRGISCKEAVENCVLNAVNNPGRSTLCTFDGRELFRLEPKPGLCAKNVVLLPPSERKPDEAKPVGRPETKPEARPERPETKPEPRPMMPSKCELDPRACAVQPAPEDACKIVRETETQVCFVCVGQPEPICKERPARPAEPIRK
jgi:hypothetical protein